MATDSESSRSLTTLRRKIEKNEADSNRIIQDFIDCGLLQKSPRSGTYDLLSVEKLKEADLERLREIVELALTKLCNLDAEVQSIKLLSANLQAEVELSGLDTNELSGQLAEFEEKSKEKLRRVEARATMLSEHNGNLENEVECMRSKLAALTRENQNYAASKTFSQLEIEKGANLRQKLQRQLEAARQEALRERDLRSDLELSLSAALERSQELQSEAERSIEEATDAKRDLLVSRKEEEKKREEVMTTKQRLQHAENLVKTLKEKLSEQQAELKIVSSERDFLQQKTAHSEDQTQGLTAQVAALQERLQAQSEGLERLQEENKKLQKALSDSERQVQETVAQYEERLEIQKQCFDETDRVIDLREKLRLEVRLRDQTDARLKELSSEMDIARREFAEKERNWSAEVRERDLKLRDAQSKLQTLKEEKMRNEDERGHLLEEVKDCVNKLTDEKSRLDCQLTESQVEVEALGHTRSTLELQNAQLRERVTQLEQQASHYGSWDSTLNELVDSKKRIAYERGKLQSRVEQLKDEMESLIDVQSQHNQLKRSFASLETKYSKTQADLSQCRLQVQALESQLRQRDESLQRKEKDFQLAVQSRDEAVKEAQRLLGHVEAVEERERKRVAAIQASLDESKADGQRVRDSLESMMKSHSQLQHAIELMQTELGQKDANIQLLREEKNGMSEKQRKQLAEINALTSRISDLEDMERTEIQPLRQALQSARMDASKLTNQIEALQRELADAKGKVRSLEEEVTRKDKRLEDFTRQRETSELTYKAEVQSYEERIESLRAQLARERDNNWKRCDKETSEMRRQLDDTYRKNAELTRSCTALRHQVTDLEFQIKDAKSRLETQLAANEQAKKLKLETEDIVLRNRRLKEDLEAMEAERKETQRKNRDQNATIEALAAQVGSLQKEVVVMRGYRRKDAPIRVASGGDADSLILSRQPVEGSSRPSLREVVGKEAVSGTSSDITDRAQHILESSRSTMGRLTDYISQHDNRTLDGNNSNLRSGGMPPRSSRTDPVLFAYRAERDFNRYIQDQINDIRSTSLRNLEELRNEIILDDLRSCPGDGV